jgi:hypothetical protein
VEGRLKGWVASPSDVACLRDDDVCFVRASPFGEPCIEITDQGQTYSSQRRTNRDAAGPFKKRRPPE